MEAVQRQQQGKAGLQSHTTASGGQRCAMSWLKAVTDAMEPVIDCPESHLEGQPVPGCTSPGMTLEKDIWAAAQASYCSAQLAWHMLSSSAFPAAAE